MKSSFELIVSEHPEEVVKDEDDPGAKYGTVGNPFFQGDPTSGLVGDQPQTCEVFLDSASSLNPDRLPAELLESQHLSLLQVLQPGVGQSSTLPVRSTRFYHDP